MLMLPKPTEPSSGRSASRADPVEQRARLHSIDTLRGFALLGILLMNIVAFGTAAYFDPLLDGANTGLNFVTYATMDIFVEGSMRAVFSMLFGAGVLLFTAKASLGQSRIRALWYRRTSLLVVFGLVDAYLLLWFGDILYVYGMVGLCLYLVRDWSPRKLLAAALVIVFVLGLLGYGEHRNIRSIWEAYEQIDPEKPSELLSGEERQAVEDWERWLNASNSGPDVAEGFISLRKLNYLDIVRNLAPINFYLQTVDFLFGSFWDALSMMLLGMALMKWRVFSAQLPSQTYWRMLIVGFTLGLGTNSIEVILQVQSGFAPQWQSWNVRPSYDIGRLGMAFGYIGLVMLFCQSGLWPRAQRALAAVGQTALSNYLMHSVICGYIFTGAGMALVGSLERWQLYPIVAGIWILQLTLSSLWLDRYRFGPLEWLWRCMTYGAWQPMKR
ncbi:MAG: DUF418 domain-containing protein [Pseudomonadota bacterium]